MSKKILIISSIPSHPSTAGNRARVATFSSSIKSYGHEVYFLYLNDGVENTDEMKNYWGDHFFQTDYRKPKSRSRKFIKKLKKSLHIKSAYAFNIDEWYDENIDKVIKNLHSSINFDVVIVEYVFYSKVLKIFNDKVLKIIDTHSIFANRHLLHLSKGMKPQWFSTSTQQEKKGLLRADIVIAIQKNDAEYFERLIPSSLVITVGHITPLITLDSKLVKNNSILIIASNNSSNLHATKYFMEEVFPLVRNSIPAAEVILAGDLCGHIQSYSGLKKLGRVDDLESLYKTTAIVVNPTLFGTGLKIKTIEALGYSKPTVTTSVGAEGLEDGIGNALLVADTSSNFANCIVKILKDKELSNKLSARAYEYACDWNNKCIFELEKRL